MHSSVSSSRLPQAPPAPEARPLAARSALSAATKLVRLAIFAGVYALIAMGAWRLSDPAWNVVFAVAVVVWAFGWSGGKQLVGSSYDDAKVKVAEQKAQRAAKKHERAAERRAKRALGS